MFVCEVNNEKSFWNLKICLAQFLKTFFDGPDQNFGAEMAWPNPIFIFKIEPAQNNRVRVWMSGGPLISS